MFVDFHLHVENLIRYVSSHHTPLQVLCWYVMKLNMQPDAQKMCGRYREGTSLTTTERMGGHDVFYVKTFAVRAGVRTWW